MDTNTALTAPAGLNPAQAMILSQRTPTDAIRYRQGRGGSQRLAYVSHAWVTRVLNEAFGFRWSWDVTDTVIVPDLHEPLEVIVRGRLTVTTPDGGTVVKEQFGSTDVKRFKPEKGGGVISLGDDLKAASSDALKKAASLLGVALDLYGASDEPLPGEEPATRPAGGATKAAAQRNGGNVTTTAPKIAQRAPQSAISATDAEFDRLPSASTAPAQAAALAKGNGNGHRPSRPTWAGPDDAKAWAAKQTDAAGVLIFAHANHVANAYDKLRRAYTADAEHPTPAGFFDRWYADVQRRIDEANAKLDAELDAQAAAEAPNF